MRHFSVSILLLAFAVFFVEAIKLPAACEKQQDSKCAMMLKKHPGCKMLAEMIKKQDRKKGKCNPGNCDNCPLFTVTTFQGTMAYISRVHIHQIEYSVMLNNNLSDYHCKQWKPPDAFLI